MAQSGAPIGILGSGTAAQKLGRGFLEHGWFGEVLVLSVRGSAAEDVVRLAGAEPFDGKVLLDASDPLDFSSGRPGLFVGTNDSLGERIQRLVSRAHVVKGLNIVAADVMVDPTLTGGGPRHVHRRR